MRILLLSAYDALSHRYWREGLVEQFPDYQWTVLALAPRYFNYRVRANPLSWLSEQHSTLSAGYDLIIATSFVDIATLRGLVPALATTPLWLYCHENQFVYPESAQQAEQKLQADNKRQTIHDLEAKMVFLYGCMAADVISFNSAWNRDSAFAGMAELLHRFPEKLDSSVLDSIKSKANIIPVPLQSIDPSQKLSAYSGSGNYKDKDKDSNRDSQTLSLLWNHRWEYDKGPETLLALVNTLDKNNFNCEINIVGQQFRQIPAAFNKIKQILHESSSLTRGLWGYIKSKQQYQQLLQHSNIVISTASHEFQGIAVLEAVQAGCVPLLPNSLAYPEIFTQEYLFAVERDTQRTANLIYTQLKQWQQSGLPLSPEVSDFEWPQQRNIYQRTIESLK